MTYRWTLLSELVTLFALLSLASCLADPGRLGAPLAGLPVHEFVLDIAGDSLLPDTLVRLDLQIDPRRDHDTLFGTWLRVDSTDLASIHSAVSGARKASQWQLTWMDDNGASLRFKGDEAASEITGELLTAQGSASARLLPLSLDSARTPDDWLRGWFDPGSRAVVSLRADDSPATDSEFVSELDKRQLMGEFGIITGRVGSPGFLSWTEVQDLAVRGFGIVAHSRRHAVGFPTLGAFAWELVGAKNDLLAHGIYTRAFAIPGVWRGASYLNSVAKVQSTRGRLARRFYQGTYAWVYAVPNAIPLADSTYLGITHVPGDDMPIPTAMTILRAAIRMHGYMQILFHTHVANKVIMRTLLDSIAQLRDQGLVTVTSSSVGLTAARDGAPNLDAAGGGPFASTTVRLFPAHRGACSASEATLNNDWIAVGEGCRLLVRLKNPPRGTAIAVEGMWRVANPGDSLELTLVDPATPRRVRQHTCVGALRPTFCSVRLGVLARNTTVTAIVTPPRARDTVWLNSFALSIK